MGGKKWEKEKIVSVRKLSLILQNSQRVISENGCFGIFTFFATCSGIFVLCKTFEVGFRKLTKRVSLLRPFFQSRVVSGFYGNLGEEKGEREREGDRGRVRSFQYDRALLMATIIVLMTLDTNTKKERRRGVA